ncbi:MAG TPA: uracil-DNA glycosylase [bacterium]|nr:uracil-DNA glycosylase [bacterium]
MDRAVTAVRARDSLARLSRDVVACTACPRLRRHCDAVAARGKPEFAGFHYWGRPVPGFGDARAALVIVGLAPAAHGANRTGRMFTGDSSAAWLVRAMHRAGFANQPTSLHRDDGLRLRGAYLTAPVRCAPPANKPTRGELERCLPYLEREVRLLRDVRVLMALGRIAFEVCRRLLRGWGAEVRGVSFGHGACYEFGPGRPALIASYHPSRQNTNTGKLTEPMLDQVFRAARSLVDGAAPAKTAAG